MTLEHAAPTAVGVYTVRMVAVEVVVTTFSKAGTGSDDIFSGRMEASGIKHILS